MGLRGVGRTLLAVDRVLVLIGDSLGSRIRSNGVRDLAIISGYGFAYLLVTLAPAEIGLPLLWLCWFVVIAHSRSWVSNEAERRDIARGLSDVDPDSLPDLRRTAFLSAMQLFVIIPLLFDLTDRVFGIGETSGDTDIREWMLFSIDLLSRSLLDWAEVYEISFSSITPNSMWTRHMILLQLLTIDFLLVQAIIRLLEIRRITDEGVRATARDPDHSVRLGKRAVKPLIRASNDPALEEKEISSIAIALGRIGDSRAAPGLVRLFGVSTVEVDALAASMTIDHHPTLSKAARSDRVAERRCAASWCNRTTHPGVIPILLRLVNDAEARVRREAVRSLESQPPDDVEEAVVQACTDEDERTRRIAVGALRRHVGEASMFAAIRASTDSDVEIRRRAVEALSSHPDGRVVQPLADRLEDEDESVRDGARSALEHLESLRSRS